MIVVEINKKRLMVIYGNIKIKNMFKNILTGLKKNNIPYKIR